MPRHNPNIALMPFGDHLEELRRRLIYALYGLVPLLIFSFLVGKRLLAALFTPVEIALREANQAPFLQATSPLETFGAWIKLSLILSLVLASPWIIYQGWLFIAPGLYANERRFAYLLAPLSAILTTCGVLFFYYVILPIVLVFFVNFGATLDAPGARQAPLPAEIALAEVPVLNADPIDPAPGSVWFNAPLKQLRIAIPAPGASPTTTPAPASTADGATPAEPSQPAAQRVLILGTPFIAAGVVAQQYKVSEYLGLVLNLAGAFAIAFQLPVVILLLGWAGIIEPSTLNKYRRQAIMACAVAGAFLTPADPVSMMLLAVPLYGLYEFGGLLLRIVPASRVAAGFGGAREEM